MVRVARANGSYSVSGVRVQCATTHRRSGARVSGLVTTVTRRTRPSRDELLELPEGRRRHATGEPADRKELVTGRHDGVAGCGRGLEYVGRLVGRNEGDESLQRRLFEGEVRTGRLRLVIDGGRRVGGVERAERRLHHGCRSPGGTEDHGGEREPAADGEGPDGRMGGAERREQDAGGQDADDDDRCNDPRTDADVGRNKGDGDGNGCHHQRGQCPAYCRQSSPAPRHRGPQAAQRGHRWHEGGRVVGVQELQAAEEAEGQHEPGGPEDDGGPQRIGARPSVLQDQEPHRGHHGRQEQPGVVVPEGPVQEPIPGGGDAEGAEPVRDGVLLRRHEVGRRATASRGSAEQATEPSESVVGEHLGEDRVVAAAVDVGAAGRGDERDDRHPAQ